MLKPVNKINGGDTHEISKKFTNFAAEYFAKNANYYGCMENGIRYPAEMRNLPPLHIIYDRTISINRSDKLFFFNANHLGSGSLITDGNGQTYQTLAYTPYGGQLVDIKHYSDIYDEPYRFGGKIKDEESGLHYFEMRYSDGEKFISTDPLWWKSPDKTPYHFCSNDPINRRDPSGMTDYHFDENGNAKLDKNGKIITSGKVTDPHRAAVDVKGKDGKITTNYYTLADQKNDKADIENGIITQVVMVNKGDMKKMLEKGGGFENKNANIDYMLRESPDRGKLDFMYEIVPDVLAYKGLIKGMGVLYISEGDAYAHNDYNFGNFMWGAAGYTLGFAEWQLRGAAHIFTRKKEGEWDSADDQFSISRGVESAKQNNYRSLRR
jgi:RHS repeat-associated protein